MLVGVVAFNVLKVVPASEPRSIGILLTGYVFQGQFKVAMNVHKDTHFVIGLGFFMTFFYICIYIIRYVVAFSSLLSNTSDAFCFRLLM